MGDTRYERHLARVLEHGPDSLGELSDEEIVQALAALGARAGGRDAYLANILASEAMNRLGRAHAIVAHSNVALLSVDLDGASLSANPAAQALLGWSQHELRGIHLHTLVHSHDASDPCGFEDALRSATPTLRRRSVFTRRDGSSVAVEYSIAPIAREGEKSGMVIAFHAADMPGHGAPSTA